MKNFTLYTSIMIFASIWNQSYGFTLEPMILETGQSIIMKCDPTKETACLETCDHHSICQISENFCRDCAGTQSLKLKLILDHVGTTIVSKGEPKPDQELITVLRTHQFITLHPSTLYNYSSPYDGAQIRAQFKYLCPHLDLSSDQSGILVIQINADHTIGKIQGAICPEMESNQAKYYSIKI